MATQIFWYKLQINSSYKKNNSQNKESKCSNQIKIKTYQEMWVTNTSEK